MRHEAIHVLYQLHTFDFTKHVGGIVPFLRSLPEETRQNLRGIAMELRDKRQPDQCCGGLDDAWGTGPDNQAAWGRACSYIATNSEGAFPDHQRQGPNELPITQLGQGFGYH